MKYATRAAIFNALAIGTTLAIALAAASCQKEPKLPAGLYAVIETSRGTIIADLDYRKAPLAVANFVGLAEGTLDATGGKPFYDGLTFHRVEPKFIIQGGDPAGDGSGDAGYTFPVESSPDLSHDAPGVLGMANHGPGTNSCQFYITMEPAINLDGSYTAFGRVVSGMNVVTRTVQGDIIKRITVRRVGDEAAAFGTDQVAWNALYVPLAEAERVRKAGFHLATIAEIQARWPGMVTRPDTIMERVDTKGTGEPMGRFAIATVNYSGMFSNGMTFDKSPAGQPLEFETGVGNVIAGWDLVLAEMRKGEKRTVAFPPEYGYGARGYSNVIPPDAYLVFEIELVDFKL